MRLDIGISLSWPGGGAEKPQSGFSARSALFRAPAAAAAPGSVSAPVTGKQPPGHPSPSLRTL